MNAIVAPLPPPAPKSPVSPIAGLCLRFRVSSCAARQALRAGAAIMALCASSLFCAAELPPHPDSTASSPAPVGADSASTSKILGQQGIDKFKKGDWAGAAADLGNAVNLDPTDVVVLRHLGAALHHLKDDRGALTALNRALELNPNAVGILLDRAEVRISLGDRRAAMVDFDRAVASGPGNAEAYRRRGTCRRHLADWTGAAADLGRSLELNPKSADALAERAQVREHLGDAEGARSDWHAVLALAPKDTDAAQALARLEGTGHETARVATAPAAATAPASAAQPVPSAPPLSSARPANAAPSTAPVSTAGEPSGSESAAETVPEKWINAEALAGGRPGGEVLATKALMRVLGGPVDPAQEPQFNAAYAKAYQQPTPKRAAHHSRLNNHLIDAIVQREMMLRSLREHDAAMLEAQIADRLGNPAARDEALSIAELQNATLELSAKQLQAIADTVEAEEQGAGDDAEQPLTLAGSAAYRNNLAALLNSLTRPAAPTPGLLGKWVLLDTKIEQKTPGSDAAQKFSLSAKGGAALWTFEQGAEKSYLKSVAALQFAWTGMPQEMACYEQPTDKETPAMRQLQGTYEVTAMIDATASSLVSLSRLYDEYSISMEEGYCVLKDRTQERFAFAGGMVRDDATAMVFAATAPCIPRLHATKTARRRTCGSH